MASGVKISDEVMVLYNEMKVPKKHSDVRDRIRLVKLRIVDGEIKATEVIQQKDEDEPPYKDKENWYEIFISLFSDKECCYVLYDCHYKTNEKTNKEELAFVSWAPDTACVKERMKYASSNEAVKKALTGIKHNWQMNDKGDLEFDSVCEKLGKDAISVEGRKVKPGGGGGGGGGERTQYDTQQTSW